MLCLLLAAGGCGQPEFPSRWLDRQVVIDGDPRDWTGAVYSLDGERTVAGFFNDSTDLYVCLVSSDPNVSRQVLGRGLTLWLDPDGGRAKTFGIRYPLGARDPGAPPPRGGGDPDRRVLAWAFPDSTAEAEIIEGGALLARLPLGQVQGVKVRVGLKDDVLTYEARIPLARDEQHPHAIDARRDRPIGLGLETPRFELPVRKAPAAEGNRRDGSGDQSGDSSDPSADEPSREPSDEPSGGPPGGSRGEHRGTGHPGGWRGTGRGPASLGPVLYWIRVRLEEAAAPARAASTEG
jgi:hypothetical protein